MFERYSEKARRVIFFARYEASNCGSPYIDTEHLLLGLLRENRALVARFAQTSTRELRNNIEKHIARAKPLKPSDQLPLTNQTKHVLALAADSADKAGDRKVTPRHLLLGILRLEECGAAKILLKKESATS